jgi:hypothetical protein
VPKLALRRRRLDLARFDAQVAKNIVDASDADREERRGDPRRLPHLRRDGCPTGRLGLTAEAPRHVAGAELLAATLVVQVRRPERATGTVAQCQRARLVVGRVNVDERGDRAALERGMQVERQVGVGHELMEEGVHDPLGQEAAFRAREHPVGIDRPALLGRRAASSCPMRRRVRERHTCHRAGQRCGLELAQNPPADVDAGGLIAVEAGLQVQRGAGTCAPEQRDRQLHGRAIRVRADGHAAEDAAARLSGQAQERQGRPSLRPRPLRPESARPARPRAHRG